MGQLVSRQVATCQLLKCHMLLRQAPLSLFKRLLHFKQSNLPKMPMKPRALLHGEANT